MEMNSYSAELLAKLFNMLNELADYAVLRNFEGLPEHNHSRDIDIAIRMRDYKRVKPRIVDLINENGWKIVTYLNSDRLVTFVVGRLDSAHNTELIQLDFFFNTSVFGIELLSAEELLRNREFNGKIYYPNISVQFLDKYLYDRAVGAAYPEKYSATRAAAENSQTVKDKLRRLFRCGSADECDKTSGRKLLMRAAGYNMLHRPLGFIAGLANFLRTFVGNYIGSRTGFSIGFTGPDGSGKTTVIDRTVERLGAVFASAHAYYHFRPALFGNLGEVAHSAGIKKEVDRNYDKPHRGGKTGMLSSLVRLAYYSIDYIVGYFVKVKSKTRITRLVIFDRYYTDIICDSRRSRIYLNHRFLYWFGRIFIPSLDYNILLTASTETILSRKRELDAAGIETINRKIEYLSTKSGYYKILNESTPDAAVTQILQIVFERQHRNNLKRLI